MGVLAEVGRLAVADWSPGGSGAGFIAAATYAGAIDTAFAASASLDLLSIDLARAKLLPLASLPIPDRCSAVHWGAPSRPHPAGLIAAGLADGSLRIWDAASLIRAPPTPPDGHALIAKPPDLAKHDAAVRALAFDPFLQTRLASAAADGTVLVWDLANPASITARAPNAPTAAASTPTSAAAAANAPKDEITALAWNRKVQNIVGTTSAAGVMHVWDLRKNVQVINIRNPRGRLRASTLAWHPDVATQVVVACDEDDSTAALLWDLRNATAPVRAFSHHSPKGVVSASWSAHDPDLLLTSSRDKRTVGVSVSTGEVIVEAPPAGDWNFDVKWSPRIPGLYLSSSIDGRLSVNSMLTATTTPTVSSETATALADSFGEAADGFQPTVALQSPRESETQRVQYNLTRPPKWLKRPASVSFSFGGSWAGFNSKDERKVNIKSITEDIPGFGTGTSKLDAMLLDLTIDDPSPAFKWCQDASKAATTSKDKMGWDALSCLFQKDSRRKFLEYLGFTLPPKDAVDDIDTPVYGVAQSQPLAVPNRPAPPSAPPSQNKITGAVVEGIANGTAGMKLDGPAPWDDSFGNDANKKESILDGDDAANGTDAAPNEDGLKKEPVMNGKSFAGKSRAQLDAIVKQAVIIGDFKTAVEACLQAGRTADALVIAHAGGPDLWFHTQAEYLSKSSVSSGASVVGAVAGPKIKMDEYIRESAKSGKDAWKEALAVLLTYSPTEELPEASTALGQRLLEKKNEDAALFCFICAGNTRMAANTWMRQPSSNTKTVAGMLKDRIDNLTTIIERVRLLSAASLLSQGQREIGTVRAMDEVSGAALCEYGALLAAQGNFSLAITYLSNLDPSHKCAYGTAEDLQAKAAEELNSADTAVAGPTQASYPTTNAYNTPYNPYGTQPSFNNPTSGMNNTQSNNAYGMPQPVPPPTNTWSSAPSQPAPPPPAPSPYQAPASGAYRNQSNGTVNPVSSNLPPRPGMGGPPRPQGVVAQARAARDPSSVYQSAPTFTPSTGTMPPPPAAGVSTPGMPPPPSTPSMPPPPSMPTPPPMPTPPSMPAPPSMPVNPSAPATPNMAMPPAPSNPLSGPNGYQPPSQPGMTPGGGYGGMGMMGGGGFGGASAPPPPPPPPSDSAAPPPMSYHAKATPGRGATLPPSAEIAVAAGKAQSISGTPGGPPRRSASTSSSLSGLDNEVVLLDKADVSKVSASQQVIVKSLRGAYMYAQGRNPSPMYRRKMDDVNKRLGRLVSALNGGSVDNEVSELLVGVGKAIENGNYDEAKTVVGTLSRQHWDANRYWIQGLKWLIDCVVNGR